MIRIESNDKKNLVVSIAVFLVGLLFMKLTSGPDELTGDRQAAFLLGFMLAAIGGLNLIYRQRFVTEINPDQKVISHFSHNALFGKSVKKIPFSEVARVAVHFIGDYESRSYHLSLILKDGEKLQTGKWTSDEQELKTFAKDIADVMGCKSPPVPLQTNYAREIENVLLAGFVAIAAYAVYYKFQAGSLNKAMWICPASGFFILISWLICYQIIHRFRKQYSKN